MRTFIAIDLVPSLKEALQDLVEVLRKTRADVRWVNMPGMHLTLKFLGETATDTSLTVGDVLSEVASRHRPFPLVLEGTGSFPRGRTPRVLWVGIKHQPALLALQEDLERDLEEKGFPREAREFHPHLTLGRVKGPSFVREAVAELEKRGGTVFGEMNALNLTFFESLLGPGGARYRVISEHPLS